MKVGWEFVSWTSTRPIHCEVGSCQRVISSGWVRVDQPDPTSGTPVLCVDCHGMILLGIDPDPGANVPQWEQANRDERLREVLDAD